jgi:hypothetical protein
MLKHLGLISDALELNKTLNNQQQQQKSLSPDSESKFKALANTLTKITMEFLKRAQILKAWYVCFIH